MGQHWVRARRPITRHDMTGAYRTYQPGDWFEVRNQELRELVQQGMVDTTPQILRDEYDFSNAGILVRGQGEPPSDVRSYGLKIEHDDKMWLPWDLTVLWRPGARLTAYGAVLGLTRLVDKTDAIWWEIVAAMASMTKLARDIGPQAERDKTLEAVGDLRLPVYDTGVVWVRKTGVTQELVQLWQEELNSGGNEQHAFLRTLYTRRVLLCTLPADWVAQWAWA